MPIPIHCTEFKKTCSINSNVNAPVCYFRIRIKCYQFQVSTRTKIIKKTHLKFGFICIPIGTRYSTVHSQNLHLRFLLKNQRSNYLILEKNSGLSFRTVTIFRGLYSLEYLCLFAPNSRGG
jgi:hypothetical protein